MSEKIQKILSNLGYGSRRCIENMIKCGNILVNQKKAVIGQHLNISNFNEIIINQKKITLKKNNILDRVIIYNKPIGEICTRFDVNKRATVFEKLPMLKFGRWVSVGRLDINTRGLLLFTNNGCLANKLMHPRSQIEREYLVRVFGDVNQNKINILTKKLNIQYGHFSIKIVQPLFSKKNRKNRWFKVILREGKNRAIRLMFQTIQCQVNKLIRVRYGNIVLPHKLKDGHWMELNNFYLNNLYNFIAVEKN